MRALSREKLSPGRTQSGRGSSEKIYGKTVSPAQRAEVENWPQAGGRCDAEGGSVDEKDVPNPQPELGPQSPLPRPPGPPQSVEEAQLPPSTHKHLLLPPGNTFLQTGPQGPHVAMSGSQPGLSAPQTSLPFRMRGSSPWEAYQSLNELQHGGMKGICQVEGAGKGVLE